MIQSKMFKKISVAFSALLMAGTLVACGGDEDSNNTSACADGQVEVGAGSSIAAGCYDTCADGTACADGKTCKTYPGGQKLCVTDTATNNTNNTNNDTCDTGKVKVSYEGSEQCMTDCATDASVCGATEECTSVGSNKVCTPAEQPACGDGEVETVYAGGTKSCYDTCTGDADCAADGKICKTDDAGANMICVAPSAAETLCQTYCSLMYGSCLATNCAGLTDTQKMSLFFSEESCLNGIPAQNLPACATRLNGQDSLANYEKALAEQVSAGGTCDNAIVKLRQAHGMLAVEGNSVVIADFASACGVGEPSLNKPCMDDSQCDAGVIQASCDADDKTCGAGACIPVATNAELQQALTDGGGQAFFDGAPAGCGVDTFCVAIQQGQQAGTLCLEQCFGNEDCAYGVTGDMDAGSACTNLITFEAGADPARAGFCLPACAADADCPAVMDGNGQTVNRVCGANRSCQSVCETAGAACGPNNLGVCTAAKEDGKLGCQMTYKRLPEN